MFSNTKRKEKARTGDRCKCILLDRVLKRQGVYVETKPFLNIVAGFT